MDEKRIIEIAEKFKNVKVAIFGNHCIDAYWFLDPGFSEVSVETGLAGQAVKSQYYNPGGASNVVANLAALNPRAITAIGVIGNDIFGREILRQFKELGINTGYIVIQKNEYDTVAFGKRYLGGKEKNRIDFGFFNRMTEETEKRIIEYIDKALEENDVFIFNQQVPDSIDNSVFLQKINDLIKKHSDKTVLSDTRNYSHLIKNTCKKLNESEALRLVKPKINTERDIDIDLIKRIAADLFKESKKPVFITRGDKGLAVMDNKGFSAIPGTQILKEIDPVGAGDTVVSALALCLALKIEPAEAATFANLAASVTVKKLYMTGTASVAEIIEDSKDIRYIYKPELAEDMRKAKYLDGSEFELCYDLKKIKTGKIKHVIFDHDGTISILRQGWEEIMEDVMLKSICGDKYQDIRLELFNRIKKRVDDYIDKSTGIQTMLQMEELIEMVKEFNLIPENLIMDKFSYKKIYNAALLKIVNSRIGKIESLELNTGDFTIRGVAGFLQRLKDRGITLYLASGTDKEDVVNEAEKLGYAHLFNGGIYGSLDDIKNSSKKMVFEKIMERNNLQGSELAVFGDGPVEISECRKNGGVAIGVASDEIRGFGLNINKRERLIKAGAHMIIPDFTQYLKLLDLLF